MSMYFEPVNLLQWNMLDVVKAPGHIEPFLATNAMEKGDVVLLHVGRQVPEKESGIYAYGTIVKPPYVLQNSPGDYCNNKNTVNVRIENVQYDKPFVTHKECIEYINQFRTVHKISEEAEAFFLKCLVIGEALDKDQEEEVLLFPDELTEEEQLAYNEGAGKQVLVNSYERNADARKKCIDYYKEKDDGRIVCQICGFDFGKIYGPGYDGLIHIHHVVPIASIGSNYTIDPINDLIPVCPNCHMALHSKNDDTVEELKEKVKKQGKK